MNIVITILLVVAGIIALLLIIALFIKREHYVRREIIINAPHGYQFVNFEKHSRKIITTPDFKRDAFFCLQPQARVLFEYIKSRS